MDASEAVAKTPVKPSTDLSSYLDSIPDDLIALANALLSPWTIVQIALIALGYVLSVMLRRVLDPMVETQLRKIREQPKLLRFLVLLRQRIHWIVFAFLLWIMANIIGSVTWPSRSYFLWIGADLVTAWVVISVASRLIKSRSLGNILALSAWSLAALFALGMLDKAFTLLNAIAIYIGDFHFSLLLVLKGAALLAFLLWLARLATGFVETRLKRSEDLTPSLQVLIAKLIKVVFVLLAVVVSLSSIGIDLTALTVLSGAVGLGIGFGLQKVVSNLISGIIILLDKSIKPGDVISLGGTFGWITGLRSRYVSVVTRDGVEYLIPNENFVTEQVVNWSFSNRNVRQEIKFGTSYRNDPHQVRQIACEAVLSVNRVMKVPPPVCHIIEFGDSSVNYVLRFWIRDPEKGLANIRGGVFLAIWDAFKDNGIEIPYPHREVILHQSSSPQLPDEIQQSQPEPPQDPAEKLPAQTP